MLEVHGFDGGGGPGSPHMERVALQGCDVAPAAAGDKAWHIMAPPPALQRLAAGQLQRLHLVWEKKKCTGGST